mmetsp:Transcript_8287/g.13862  ORF Transcript_8287/g.13862 Transcript_8287/m.13862 type:complete len:208 (+) Transcript_8287:533-1156(+)
MLKFVEKVVGGRRIKRKVIASAVDYKTAGYFPMDFDDLEPSEYPTAIVASSSFPVAFPPTKFKGRELIDGGSVWNLNIISALDKCVQLGYERDEDIVLDVILLDPMGIPKLDSTKGLSTKDYYFRYNAIKGQMKAANDIVEFLQSRQSINYRYLVFPEVEIMPDWQLLLPTPELETKTIEMGRADAQTSMALGPGGKFKEFVNYVSL